MEKRGNDTGITVIAIIAGVIILGIGALLFLQPSLDDSMTMNETNATTDSQSPETSSFATFLESNTAILAGIAVGALLILIMTLLVSLMFKNGHITLALLFLLIAAIIIGGLIVAYRFLVQPN